MTYSKEINCSVCDYLVHEWKSYHLADGRRICSSCYHLVVDGLGVNFTLQETKRFIKGLEEHRQMMNNYVLILKKYGTVFQDEHFLERIVILEQELSARAFNKHREAIIGTEEELFLTATILMELQLEFPSITVEELEQVSSMFHPEHKRYYPYI